MNLVDVEFPKEICWIEGFSLTYLNTMFFLELPRYLNGVFFILDLERHGGDLRAMIWDTSTMSTLHPFEAMLHSLNPSTNLVMLVVHRNNPCVSLTGP